MLFYPANIVEPRRDKSVESSQSVSNSFNTTLSVRIAEARKRILIPSAEGFLSVQAIAARH